MPPSAACAKTSATPPASHNALAAFVIGLLYPWLKPRIERQIRIAQRQRLRQPECFGVMTGGLPNWVGELPVSNDGKWLLFPQRDEISSDLMMIENWN